MLKIFNLQLDPVEKNAFRLHTIYSSIEGFILGILALNEFVFIKSLQGSNYQLSFLFQFSVIVFIFLLFINEYIKKIRDRRKLLLITGLITRLPLALLLFFPRTTEGINGNSIYHYLFLGIFLVYYFGNPVIYPNINLLLKTNYGHKNFGALYSYATSINKVMMLVVTFLYGLLLDADNYAFVYVFPIVALAGVSSVYILTKIPYLENYEKTPSKPIFLVVGDSIRNMIQVLKSNVPYRHFEAGFMFYGFGFMISYPIIYIYFYEALALNYTSVAFYRNSYNILAILILPFFGKLMGKIDPRKFANITYSSLALYLFFLAITTFLPFYVEWLNIKLYYTLIFYVIFQGFFAATMVLLWNIGSAYFCKPAEAATYQSIHLFLVGVRGLVAPLIGIFFYELLGFNFTFGLAIIFPLIGIYIMIWSYRKEKQITSDD